MSYVMTGLLVGAAGVATLKKGSDSTNINSLKNKTTWDEEEAKNITYATAKALNSLGMIGPDKGMVITTDQLGNYMAEAVTRRKE